MLTSVLASLPLVSTVLASQHVLWHSAGLPHPNLWNRTCKGEEGVSFAALDNPVCPKPTINVTPKPVVRAGPLPYGPWTDVSDCIESADGATLYCIFTSTTFANNRGISVFTTPAVAEHMAQRPAFINSSVLDGVNVASSPPYSVQSLPGRGLGAIVNSTLFRGDRVMSYSPVLVAHRKTLDDLPDNDRLAFQRLAVDRLPAGTKNRVFSMHAHFGEELVEDIINTNSFQVPFGADDEPHAILLPETARMNHDCRPNVQYYFDPYTMTHHAHALRTIQPGEELTVTYTDITVSRAKRQAAIKRSWGFECACSLCRQPEIFTRESDRRLQLIEDLEKRLNDWSNKTLLSPGIVETLVSLYEQERLDGLIARAYSLGAVTYSSMGEEQAAIRYAALALERNILNYGPYWNDIGLVRDLMADPKSHWSWKARVTKPISTAS